MALNISLSIVLFKTAKKQRKNNDSEILHESLVNIGYKTTNVKPTLNKMKIK